MFTEHDEKELKRLMQKRRRARDTATRKAMLAWGNGPLGKRARQKYMENGGRERLQKTRAPGTAVYARKQQTFAESARNATNGRERWTHRDEIKLLDMHKRGIPARLIAEELNRSIRAVEHKRERLKKGE